MIKTVIFDMDGVIVDTEPVHHYAYYQHFAQLGIDVPEETYRSYTGFSTKNVYERLKTDFGITGETADLVQIKRNLFNNAFDTKDDLFLIPGVEALIKDLHRNRMRLILASSASKVTIDRVFTRFNLHHYFSYIVSGEDFPKSKPDPAIFLEAWRLSGHQKENCVVIEDSTNGIKAAKAAGLYCIGYVSENSKLQELGEADEVVSDFSALNFEVIERINN